VLVPPTTRFLTEFAPILKAPSNHHHISSPRFRKSLRYPHLPTSTILDAAIEVVRLSRRIHCKHKGVSRRCSRTWPSTIADVLDLVATRSASSLHASAIATITTIDHLRASDRDHCAARYIPRHFTHIDPSLRILKLAVTSGSAMDSKRKANGRDDDRSAKRRKTEVRPSPSAPQRPAACLQGWLIISMTHNLAYFFVSQVPFAKVPRTSICRTAKPTSRPLCMGWLSWS
jgi:hypothetical protein